MPPFNNTRRMRGATAGVAGTSGYVPAPAAGQQDFQIYGDGTWRQGAVAFKGTLAGASVPASSAAAGDYYVIISAGTSQAITWAIGDQALWNGSAWGKLSPGVTPIALGGTAAVTAAAARTNLDVPAVPELYRRADPVRGFVLGYRNILAYTVMRTAIGTEDFSWLARVTLNGAPASDDTIAWIGSSSATPVAATSLRLIVTSAGALALRLYGATTSDYNEASISGFVAAYAGSPVEVTITRSSTTLLIYINGVNTGFASATGGTPPGWGGSVVATYQAFGTLNGFATTWHRLELYNHALGATDAAATWRQGNPLIEDRLFGGSLAEVMNASTLNGGFETLGGGGADVFGTWSEETIGGTVTVETSDEYAGSNSLRLGGAGTPDVYQRPWYIPRRVNISFYAKGVSGTPTLRIQRATNAAGGAGQRDDYTLSTSWTQYTSGPKVIRDLFLIGKTVSGDPDILVDNVVIKPLGCVMWLDFTVGAGTFFPDRAGCNNYAEMTGIPALAPLHRHLVPLAAGEFVIRKEFAHNEISATANTTLLFELPPNCAILDIEIDRNTALDATLTLDVGIVGTGAKFASAIVVSTTGKILTDSLSKVAESETAHTTIYVKKSGSTSVGAVKLRVRCVKRGD